MSYNNGIVVESYPMNGGNGTYSYTKNSYLQEIISESLVDSFNLPVYFASPKEMKEIIERNGNFSIERMETTNPLSKLSVQLGAQPCTIHLRAGLEGIISKHFGNKIIDELFDRFTRKTEEHSYMLNASYSSGTQLFIVLTRK
ncbi:SAM dependent carboxyl methyltransferase [Corchorus olitorius]|uniref:SAM dependent carboxyl methyltransferase n=1 Tax=Corchorus olitorius TaxID=93759 RepID=A0A1R3HPV2_9ROSI|nr:SAM dependent carboxyl methyltransferase [Corchorus olitorius]